MNILIDNRQSLFDIDLGKIEDICFHIMKNENFSDNSELSLVFCDDCFIKDLNKEFRNIDEPTDVLSFESSINNFELDIKLVGDIVISVETACAQADRFGHSCFLEIVVLLIHGLLHLNGYTHSDNDDKKKMKERENSIYGYLSDLELFKDLFSKDASALIHRSENE